VIAALQAQAQNFMHWSALGFGLGIAAYVPFLRSDFAKGSRDF
jgi:hypothetical protein